MLALLAAVAATPAWLVVTLLAYVLFTAMCWPALESLVASDADAHTMSKRVGAYNLVWSGANAVTFAACGAIITHWRAGVFLIPAVAHVISALIMWRKPDVDPAGVATTDDHAPRRPRTPSPSRNCSPSARWRCGWRGFRCRRRTSSSTAWLR